MKAQAIRAEQFMPVLTVPESFATALEEARAEPFACAGCMLVWVHPNECMVVLETYVKGPTPAYPTPGWYIHHVYTGDYVLGLLRDRYPALNDGDICRIF